MNFWDRQKEESAKAFAAFCVYRDLGPTRSIDGAFFRTAEPPQNHRKKRAPKLWFDWSVIYQWTERADAYDQHLQEVEQKARDRELEKEAGAWAKRRIQEREREWNLSRELVEKAQKMLEFPLEKTERVEADPETGEPVKITINPARWSFRDAARMVEVATRLARLAAEMPVPKADAGTGVDEEDGAPVRFVVALPPAPQDKDEWLSQYKPEGDPTKPN